MRDRPMNRFLLSFLGTIGLAGCVAGDASDVVADQQSALACPAAGPASFRATPGDATMSGDARFMCDGFELRGTGAATFGRGTGDFGSDDFTIDFWLRDGATPPIAVAVLEKRAVCSFSDFWGVRIVGRQNPLGHAGELVFELDNTSDGGNAYNLLWSGVRVDDGLPHHVAYVREGATARVYIDGILTGSQTTASTIRLDNDAPLTLGTSVCDGLDGTVPLVGSVDRLRFFPRALSACQIAFAASQPHGCRSLPVEVHGHPKVALPTSTISSRPIHSSSSTGSLH